MIKRFSYKALDSGGKQIEGFMDADCSEDVGKWLSERNYYVLDINVATVKTIFKASKRIKISTRDMNFFLLQLSSLINAGCPLLMSIQALYRQVSSRGLKMLLKDLREKIEAGKSFSEALRNHKGVFSNLFITMVEVGETGGILGDVLERYAHIFDNTYKIKKQIFKALLYPALLIIMTIVVGWALMVYVFPPIVDRIITHGQQPPWPTRIMLAVSQFIAAYWLPAFFCFLAVLAGFFVMRKTPTGDRIIASLLVGFPILGKLNRHMQIALFARTLGTLLKCGVPILSSLNAIEKALNNRLYKEAIKSMNRSVSRGESLSKAMLEFPNLFPESVVLMTDVGERGGNTGEMLEKAGAIYENELESTIETSVAIIPHLLVIFLSVFILSLVFAVYLPLFDIVQTVG